MPERLQLSVIIASYNSENTIEGCLSSLKNQKTDKDFEVIVVDSSTDGTDELVEKGFPKVKLYKFAERKFCGDARNFGISVAKGKIIAFIDADCQAQDDWIEKIIMAHESLNSPAIGGAIANGNPESYVGWAAYFCEFSQWMPNTPIIQLDDVAGANMSYKREVFKEFGHFIEGTYCSDTDFHWRLKYNGHLIRFVPSILIYHHNIDKFRRFLLHEYNHGRSFAKVRVKSKSFSKFRRFLYVIFSPLITLKLLLKIGLINFKNRVYILHFVKTLPVLILGLISWSFGESVGYAKS